MSLLKLFLCVAVFVFFVLASLGMAQEPISISLISSWDDLADDYEQFCNLNYPLVVPGDDSFAFRTWEDVQRELTAFVRGSWFWYFPAACYRVDPKSKLSRNIRDKVDLLVYEDIYSGEIIIAAERKDGRYVEVYSRKTLPILEALALGMTTFEETSRRRIVWLPSVAPYDYVEPVEPVMRTMSVPIPPGGGGGTNSGGGGLLTGMTPEEWAAIHSASNMWIGIMPSGASGNYACKLVVHPATNITNDIDIF